MLLLYKLWKEKGSMLLELLYNVALTNGVDTAVKTPEGDNTVPNTLKEHRKECHGKILVALELSCLVIRSSMALL